MNEFLQQLASLGPGIGAGIAGNGEALKAFMEGYQRTMAQLETHKRAQTRDQLDQQELQMRHQAMTQGAQRQALMDARAAEDQEWQNTSRKMEVGRAFREEGAGAESVPEGESSIDALYRLLPPGTQTEMAPTRDAALRGVGAQVTSRQKGELRRWVQGELLKSRFVAENPESDPDITAAMPPRVRQLAESLTGQTSFRKSDILALTEVLEQAQPEKTRPPAAAGSFEEYSDPSTPAERKAQIERDRKAYMQADDRAPRVTVNTGQEGAFPPAVQRRIDAKVRGFEANPVVKKTATMAEAVSFADALDPNTTNPSDDQALIYAFAKVMDPESVVREGEYATVQKYAQSWSESFGFDVKRIFSNSPFLTPQARANMKATIRQKYASVRGQFDNIRNEYGRQIERITRQPGGVDELPDFGAAYPALRQPAAQQDGGKPKRGANPFRPQ
jgi:hypothetical protein